MTFHSSPVEHLKRVKKLARKEVKFALFVIPESVCLMKG